MKATPVAEIVAHVAKDHGLDIDGGAPQSHFGCSGIQRMGILITSVLSFSEDEIIQIKGSSINMAKTVRKTCSIIKPDFLFILLKLPIVSILPITCLFRILIVVVDPSLLAYPLDYSQTHNNNEQQI